MVQISAADLKPHLSVADDDTGNDTLIDGYIAAAEDWAAKYLRRDLDTEFPDGWPASILQAVRLLVAHWFEHREAVSDAPGGVPVPYGVKSLCAPYRDFEG